MLSIARESPDQPEIQALFAQSDAYAAALYPPEGRYPVDAAYLSGPQVRFLVARLQGKAVGCGALVLGSAGTAELKRLIVDTAMRGQGVGNALMAAIEAAALAKDIRLIQLETGPDSAPALRLYRACGYRERGPFGSYAANPHSLFMERLLTGA